jgi:hypothetical protein
MSGYTRSTPSTPTSRHNALRSTDLVLGLSHRQRPLTLRRKRPRLARMLRWCSAFAFALVMLGCPVSEASAVEVAEGPFEGKTEEGYAVSFDVAQGAVSNVKFAVKWGYCGSLRCTSIAEAAKSTRVATSSSMAASGGSKELSRAQPKCRERRPSSNTRSRSVRNEPSPTRPACAPARRPSFPAAARRSWRPRCTSFIQARTDTSWSCA